MSKSHPPYAPEYRRQMVELVHGGRTPGELAREYECSAQAIRNWVRQAERRTARYREGLERIRREHGLWVGGEDGKPRWLPPGSSSGSEAAQMRACRLSSRTTPKRPCGSSRGVMSRARLASAVSASRMLCAREGRPIASASWARSPRGRR